MPSPLIPADIHAQLKIMGEGGLGMKTRKLYLDRLVSAGRVTESSGPHHSLALQREAMEL
jgi:hypothetical protein